MCRIYRDPPRTLAWLALIGLLLGGGSPARAADRPPFGMLLAEDVRFAGLDIDRLHVGGWLDASFQDSSRSGDASHVSLNHMNGFLDLRFASHWQLFLESEVEYQPEVATRERESELEIEQLYLDYGRGDGMHVRLGSFSTPFGYWTPVHWTIATDTVAPPLFEERRYVPEQQLGAQIHGGRLFRTRGLEIETSYSVFAGYGSEAFDAEKAEGLTGGGDLRAEIDQLGFLGFSVYTQKNQERLGRREISAIVYGELALPYRFTLRGEFMTQRSSLGDRYRHAGYGKIRWNVLEDLYLNYRLERADDEELGPAAEQWVHRVTVAYWPTARTRLKAEFARHDLRHSLESDFSSFSLWFGLFF